MGLVKMRRRCGLHEYAADRVRKGLRMRLVLVVVALAACVAVVVVFVSATVRGNAETDKGGLAVRVVPPDFAGEEQELLVTGYCNCEKCCGWRKRWWLFGGPVYNYGKMKGQPKKVGLTASGSVAEMGTIAADPAMYPFGTRMAVPGYGVGTVRDIGGAIKGTHIDIWFPSHKAAIEWGTRKIKVKVAKSATL